MSLHRVVALVTPPQPPFELACASEVFGIAPPDAPPRHDFRVCAEHPGPLPTVAVRVGLASAVNLRRRFRTRFGTTPGAYRRSFGGI